MSNEEFDEIINWISTVDVSKLSMNDKMSLLLAQVEMCEAIKPIYIRNKIKEPDTFLFKL